MSEMCREFGISRKTGYKIFSRYREHGAEALTDRSRRPVRYANQLLTQIESLIVTLKQEKHEVLLLNCLLDGEAYGPATGPTSKPSENCKCPRPFAAGQN